MTRQNRAEYEHDLELSNDFLTEELKLQMDTNEGLREEIAELKDIIADLENQLEVCEDEKKRAQRTLRFHNRGSRGRAW